MNKLKIAMLKKAMLKVAILKIAILASGIAGGISANADPLATHGMVLFGDKATYVSHLPMFHSPHDYQLAMKVGLAGVPRAMTLSNYTDEKAKGQTLFTIHPQPFDLTKVMNGTITKFSASLYAGHFERGGKNLGPVIITVEKILLSKKLDPNSVEKSLDYLVFGGAGEYFAVHSIKGKPSFDAVVKVKSPYVVSQNPCRTRLCDEPQIIPVQDAELPITLAQELFGQAEQLPAKHQLITGSNSTETEIVDVIYLEQNELSH